MVKLSTGCSFVFLLLLHSFISNIAQAAIPTTERDALVALYNATGGDNWTKNINWDTSAASIGKECEWHGVTCDVEKTTVTGLHLNANNLKGALPSGLTDLAGLTSSDFRFNGVYSDNQSLIDFLDATGPVGSLLDTQTLDPANIRITAVTETSFDIAWDAASYTQVNVYKVYLATHSTEAGTNQNISTFDLRIVGDKDTTNVSVTKLSACTQYFVKVTSFTDIDFNNSIESDGERSNIVGAILVASAGCDIVGSQNNDSFTIDYETVNALPATIQVNAVGERSYTLSGDFTWNIDGVAGSNTLSVISDGTNTWELAGNNSSTVNGNSFSNIQNLVGGAGVDNFIINPGFVLNGSINGGGGTNDSIVINGDSLDGGSEACVAAGGVIINSGNILGASSCEIPIGNDNVGIIDGSLRIGDDTLSIVPIENGGVINLNFAHFTNGTGTFDLAENIEINTVITTVSADGLKADSLTYEIINGNEDELFIIDSSTGEITLSKTLDFETTAKYTLEVKASDDSGTSTTDTVTINVTDVNESGGCTLRSGAPFDPIWLLMLVIAVLYRIKQNQFH